MIRSGRPYSGLDDFFYTKDKDHLLSNELIQKRIEELDSLYQDWAFPFWEFSKEPMEQNRFQHYCKEVVDIFNQSYKCYIMAGFDASIIMSSVAVERLTNCVLLLHKASLGNLFQRITDSKTRQSVTKPLDDWYPVKTINAVEYYCYRKNRFVQIVLLDGNYHYFSLPSLSQSLELASRLGCPSGELLDPKERFSRCVFVTRRDKIAHGAFEEAELGEQIWYLNANKSVDPISYLSRKEAAFDQYKKATLFTRKTFEWFTSKYGTIFL
jgi:hypothetical protein